MPMIAKHVSQIRDYGYTVLKHGVSDQTVKKIKEEVLEIRERRWQRSQSAGYPKRENGSVFGLQNESLFLLRQMFSNSKVTQILIALLNDPWYQAIDANRPNYISRNGVRAQSSGKEGLYMHIDSLIPGKGRMPWLVQVFIILEDQTEENGTTIVVPESHLFDEYPGPEAMELAVPVCPKSGDILIWDGRLWHGTAPNPEGRSRLVLASGFSSWFIKQKFDLTQSIPDHIYQQLSDDEKIILGFGSPTFSDEFDPRFNSDTHNSRGGYDLFPEVAPSVKKHRSD